MEFISALNHKAAFTVLKTDYQRKCTAVLLYEQIFRRKKNLIFKLLHKFLFTLIREQESRQILNWHQHICLIIILPGQYLVQD